MNIHDLTLNQLKQAVSIKQHIERLNRELRNILLAPRNSRGASTKKSMMRASTKKKIAAAQKARWATLRRSEPAPRSAKSGRQAAQKRMSPTARAKLSAKLKAYWAAKKKTNRG